MRKPFLAFLIGAALGLPGLAAAQAPDQFFRIEMSGLEHCADFDNFKFNAKNNVDMWVRIIDGQEWDLSLSDLFLETDTLPIIGHTYLVSSKKQSFIGSQFVGETGFIAIDGAASLDKNGVVTKLSGTFIQDTGDDPNDPNSPACTSSGKFKSVERTVVPP